MNENSYQSKLIRRLKIIFPNAIILKNDANYRQGIPDLVILYRGHYACLEVKRNENAPHRPNQYYYILKITNDGGYASFIYPENEEKVFKEIKLYFT